jgi:acyl carrier protein
MAYNPVLWQEVTAIVAENLRPEHTFENLGFDSLSIVEIIMTAEERFGVSIVDEEVLALRTIGEVVAYIDGLVTAAAPRALAKVA